MPIHVASSRAEGCWNYFVPSYTPTLGALLESRRRYRPVSRQDARLLLVAVPRPFKMNPLPGAIMELEAIKSSIPSIKATIFPSTSSLAKAWSGSATCHDVLSNVAGVNILHLACHGYADTTDVLESGFVMADRMLTVKALMGLNIPHAFFAFLSACETAKASNDQPDQAVHLAATMLFAGFKSIIGTMWYVPIH